MGSDGSAVLGTASRYVTERSPWLEAFYRSTGAAIYLHLSDSRNDITKRIETAQPLAYRILARASPPSKTAQARLAQRGG